MNERRGGEEDFALSAWPLIADGSQSEFRAVSTPKQAAGKKLTFRCDTRSGEKRQRADVHSEWLGARGRRMDKASGSVHPFATTQGVR